MKNKKKITIPSGKSVKVVSLILLTVFIIELILLILGIDNKNIAYYTWVYMIIPIKSTLYAISQYVSFKIGKIQISLFIIILLLVVISLIIYYIVLNSEKIKKRYKYKISDALKVFELIVLFIEFGVYVGIELMTYNNPKIDTIYFKEQVNNKYTKEDIFEYTKKLENKVIEYAKKVQRDEKGYISYDGKLENIAVKDMIKAAERYDILKGVYPNRFLKFSKKEQSQTATKYGETKFDTVNINYNQSAPKLLNTITHELCHTRGIKRENEAVLCSVMVGIESDNTLSNYSAYLEAYSWALESVELLDESLRTSSEDRIASLCLNNNYQEICTLYNGESLEYIEGSNEIEIGTYNTSNYEKEELEELIKEFNKFRPVYYINGETVDKEIILDKVKENDHIIISLINNKEFFSKMQKTLNKYKYRLQYISQLSENDYKGPELTKDNAEEYYVSEIPDSNVVTHFEEKKEFVYDYSRATRLIMEYFDNENI